MSGASFTPQHHNTQRRARPPKALIALDASVPFLQHTAQGAAAESCHTAFAKHSLAAVRGVGRDLRKPPNRCRPPGYKRQQYSAGESGAAERLYPLPAHDLSDIAGCPPKAARLLPPIWAAVQRGERAARQSICARCHARLARGHPPKAVTQLLQSHGLAVVHGVGRDR